MQLTTMPIRAIGISAKVPESRIYTIIKKIRKELGDKYEVAIKGNEITVRGNLHDYKVREELIRILSGE